VKLRGFRVELGEIEATLRLHESLRQAVVVLRELAPGDLGLAAYYAPAPAAGGPEPRELRGFLEAHLPDYMVPAVFMGMDALPVTATGKVDRKALPEPGGERFGAGGPYVPPSTPAEEALAALWRDLLGAERVGAHDDFFALGGHSLLAVRLVARLRERFPGDLNTRLVFQTPTLAAMARALENLAANAVNTAGRAEPSLVALPRPGRRPRAQAATS
jgi:hypothetical protein